MADVRAGLGTVTAAVLAGELLAARIAVAPGLLGAAAAVAGVLWCLAWRGRRLLGWAAIALAAGAAGAARMAALLALPAAADDVAHLALPRRAAVVGRLAAAPVQRGERSVLVLAVEAVDGKRASGLLRVGVGAGRVPWGFGDRLRFAATLRRPRNFANPGSFDYVGHLARQKIRVTAFVRDVAAVERLPGRAHGLRARLERWRARLGRRIAAAVPAPEAAVLQALVIGEEGGIPAELREAFRRAGVVHVLSVSGLHVGMVAAASVLAARALLARSERLLLLLDVDRLAALLGLVPVALYAALAGLGVATLRSALMVAAAVVAGLIGRRADVLRTLALAALVLALVWPGTPLDISFQLSFVSVLAIVLGARRLPASRGSWRTRSRSRSSGRSWWASGSAGPSWSPLRRGLRRGSSQPLASPCARASRSSRRSVARRGRPSTCRSRTLSSSACSTPCSGRPARCPVGGRACSRSPPPWGSSSTRPGGCTSASGASACASPSSTWGRVTPRSSSCRTEPCSWSTRAVSRAATSTPGRPSSARFSGRARSSGSMPS